MWIGAMGADGVLSDTRSETGLATGGRSVKPNRTGGTVAASGDDGNARVRRRTVPVTGVSRRVGGGSRRHSLRIARPSAPEGANCLPDEPSRVPRRMRPLGKRMPILGIECQVETPSCALTPPGALGRLQSGTRPIRNKVRCERLAGRTSQGDSARDRLAGGPAGDDRGPGQVRPPLGSLPGKECWGVVSFRTGRGILIRKETTECRTGTCSQEERPL